MFCLGVEEDKCRKRAGSSSGLQPMAEDRSRPRGVSVAMEDVYARW